MPDLPTFSAERWLSAEESVTKSRSSLRDSLAPAFNLPRRFLRFSSTTPGQLAIVATVLIFAIFAAGGSMVLSAEKRQQALNTLVTQSEPLSNAAQELYNSLSETDTVATTGFMQSENGGADTQRKYDESIQAAAGAIVRATHGIDDRQSREMELIINLQESLPEYVQLIQTAQTNERLSNPVGASYLSQASNLMQDRLLPAAEELYQITSQHAAEQQTELMRPMWFPMTGLFASIVFLVLAQLWLTARTNRRINIGLLSSSVLMVIALLWTLIVGLVTWNTGVQGVRGAISPLEQLTTTRILGQQARTSEALGLIERDYGEEQQEEFSNAVRDIDVILENLRDSAAQPHHIDVAREALRAWDESHAEMVYQVQQGNFPRAIATALLPRSQATGDARPSPDVPNGAKQFALFDSNLQELISDSRENLKHTLIDGRVAAQWITTFVFLITVIAAICALQGIRPRMKEYQ